MSTTVDDVSVAVLQERIIDRVEASGGELAYGLSRQFDQSLYPQLDHTQQFARVSTLAYRVGYYKDKKENP